MSMKNVGVDKRVKRTKKALHKSLLTLMQQKDLKDITITNIVELADYNRGTFYKHYKYKEDLLDEITEDIISDLVESYREPYHNVETFEVSKLTTSAIKIFEHVAMHSDFYQIIIQSNALPGFQKIITNELKRLSLEDLSVIEPKHEIASDLYASYHAYAILGMIIEWVDGGFKLTPDYMAQQLLEILKVSPLTTKFTTRKHDES